MNVALLHPGVTIRSGTLHDAATRREGVPLDVGSRDAEVLGRGFGYVPRDRLGVPGLVAAAVVGRSVAPFRVLEMSFRRRRPGPRVLSVLLAVAAAARLPAVAMVLVTGVPALVLGLAVGEGGTLLPLAGTAVVVLWTSLVAHEAAHLLTLRRIEQDHGIGAVAHSWTTVWIVCPALSTAHGRLVALAGPVAGISVSAALGCLGAPTWICVVVGAVHLANLLPSAPDGRLVFRSRAPAGQGSPPTPRTS